MSQPDLSLRRKEMGGGEHEEICRDMEVTVSQRKGDPHMALHGHKSNHCRHRQPLQNNLVTCDTQEDHK